MAKRGIDISAHNGNIDLGALKSQIDFAIIRVGYGTKGTIDDKFRRNADLCNELGIPYGFYWYSYALDVEGANKEAYAFLNAIAPYHPTMGCWFDMEDADGYKKRNGMPSNEALTNMCNEFCKIVENAGYYTGVYASLSWFNNQLAGITNYDKWVAMWPTRNGEQRGLDVNPDEKTGWSMWQFTSQGKFDGYRGNLDTNYAYHDFPNPGKPNPEPQPTPEPTPTPAPSGSTLELAVRTMNGEFGNGSDRAKNLGSRYNEVQDFINHVFTASVDTLAQEVINGVYGDGETRKVILGDRYDEIQNKVNEILNKPKVPELHKWDRVKFTGTKSYSGIPLAGWTHGAIFDVIEVSGNRVVIGKGSAVTAAVNIKDCQKV